MLNNKNEENEDPRNINKELRLVIIVTTLMNLVKP